MLLLLLACAGASLAADRSVAVRCPASDQPAIVDFPLPEALDAARDWELVDAAGTALASQSVPGALRRRVAVLPPGAAARTYHLRVRPAAGAPPEAARPGPRAVEQDGEVRLSDADRDVLSYHLAPSRPPADIAAVYARSGHIHPLWTPGQEIVTDEFAAGHPHHHGIFFAWVKTRYAGHEINFWDQAAGLGAVRHVKLVATAAGPVCAGFQSELEHVDLTAGQVPVLCETWRVTAFALAAADGMPCHVVDLESVQRAATGTPLEVEAYHYGGFGWRGPSAWRLPRGDDVANAVGCTFLTSLGGDRETGNHTRPAWVAVTGTLNGRPRTVAMLGSPANFRHPQPVRLHPHSPYFCFAPCILGPFTIGRDEPLVSRYRIVAHDGPAVPGLYAALVSQWENPAVVAVDP